MNRKNYVCTGTGLIVLDLVYGLENTVPQRFAGGSCTNVLTILSYLGWSSYPIGRIADDETSKLIKKDLSEWGVSTDYLHANPNGVSPVIIQKNYKNSSGLSKHTFEFQESGEKTRFLPYKALLKRSIEEIYHNLPTSNIFYFDRLNPASLELAKRHSENGAIVIFEPSSLGDQNMFQKALEVSHIIKFSSDRIKRYTEVFSEPQGLIEIQTEGNNGLIYRSKLLRQKNWTRLNAKEVPFDLIKDTSGAGDWCTAGIIDRLGRKSTSEFLQLNRQTLEEALNYGQSLSAISCFFLGARGAMYALDSQRVIFAANKSSNQPEIAFQETTDNRLFFQSSDSCTII